MVKFNLTVEVDVVKLLTGFMGAVLASVVATIICK